MAASRKSKGAFSEPAELPKVKGACRKTKTRKPQQAIDLKAKREQAPHWSRLRHDTEKEPRP